MLGVVVQIDGFDPATSAGVTLRAGSHDDPAVCHLDGATWWPALTRLPVLRYDLFDGAFGDQITAPSSTLTMTTEPWPDFARYVLADARLRLWTGEVGAAFQGWTLRFDGRVSEQSESENGQADVSFAVDDRWLDAALLATYAGTTGAEGSADLKGQPKPLALGAPRYIAGTLIDPVNSVFQVSGYGPVQAFEAALERLARYGDSVGDYSSYAALVAAPVPAGRWATAKAVGMARLGAPPTGQISFLVSGDAAGPNGWARRPGQLIRRLAQLSGGAGRIHDGSLDTLDAARPYDVSLYLDQQTTARQLIQQLAASVNAVAGMSWTGQLFVVPVGIGAPVVTLAADGSALPPVTKVRQIGIAAPFRKLAIGAERAWTVHALADIAFTATLTDRGPYVPGNTYREGDIVQQAGSSWLYINPAPTSGNAPPALPTTENAYWRALAKAGDKGDDGVSAAAISLTPSALAVRYDGSGAILPGQSVTWEAVRANTSLPTVWGVYDAAGALRAEGAAEIFVAGAPQHWTSSDNDHLTLTAAGVSYLIDTLGGSLAVQARLDGTTVADRKSLTKLKDGTDGAPGEPGAPGDPGDPGPPGATADDLGLGVRASGIAGVGLGSSGATVVAVSDPISLQAGRQLRLTLGCMNATKDGGSSIVTANVTARLDYSGSSLQLFQGIVSIGAEDTVNQGALSAAAAKLVSNPATGPATLVITYARGGPAGNYGSFDLAYSLERV